MNKENNKPVLKIIIAAICIILLLLYLFFINNIIMSMLPQGQQIENHNLPSDDGANYTRGGVDEIIYSGGLTETLSISGWAFTATKQDALNKCTELYLVSDTHSFHVPYSENSLRRDIYRKFIKEYDITGMYNGYAATFATFTMPKGKYSLYLYNRENESAQGLYKTGYMILKDSTGVSKLETGITENFSDVKTSGDILFELNKITSRNAIYKLSGWGFMNGTDPGEFNYFGEFKRDDGTVITTELFTTSVPDTAREYNTKENNYLHSGIVANINANDLAPGEYEFRLILKKGNEVYGSEKTCGVSVSKQEKVKILRHTED